MAPECAEAAGGSLVAEASTCCVAATSGARRSRIAPAQALPLGRSCAPRPLRDAAPVDRRAVGDRRAERDERADRQIVADRGHAHLRPEAHERAADGDPHGASEACRTGPRSPSSRARARRARSPARGPIPAGAGARRRIGSSSCPPTACSSGEGSDAGSSGDSGLAGRPPRGAPQRVAEPVAQRLGRRTRRTPLVVGVNESSCAPISSARPGRCLRCRGARAPTPAGGRAPSGAGVAGTARTARCVQPRPLAGAEQQRDRRRGVGPAEGRCRRQRSGWGLRHS